MPRRLDKSISWLDGVWRLRRVEVLVLMALIV